MGRFFLFTGAQVVEARIGLFLPIVCLMLLSAPLRPAGLRSGRRSGSAGALTLKLDKGPSSLKLVRSPSSLKLVRSHRSLDLAHRSFDLAHRSLDLAHRSL